MTRKGKPVKAPTDPKQQNPEQGFSNEKSPLDLSSQLKKLVADFKKAHKAFSDSLLQATYRLIHDARRIGDLLLKLKQEGGFKSKRQLHNWLELQAEVSIPQPTFYRYIQAAEDFQKVQVIHGTKMLTEITSNKVLKMLANPRVEPLPSDDDPATGTPSGSTNKEQEAAITPPKGKSESHDGKPHKGKKSVAEAADADPCALEVIAHDLPKKVVGKGEPEPLPPAIHITTGCKRFRIEADNRLTCLEGNGHLVTLVAESKDMAKQLKDALSTWEGGK
jgi:hypothetical protein